MRQYENNTIVRRLKRFSYLVPFFSVDVYSSNSSRHVRTMS